MGTLEEDRVSEALKDAVAVTDKEELEETVGTLEEDHVSDALKDAVGVTDKEELEETVGKTVPVPDGLMEFWAGLCVNDREGLGYIDTETDGVADAISHVKQPNV